MADRFPDYDVLKKRDTPSWNDKTREAVEKRIATTESDTLTEPLRAVLRKLVDRIVPQPEQRAPVNAAAQVLEKIAANRGDGFRNARMPQVREAWERGLKAIDAEARERHGAGFAALNDASADDVIRALQNGDVKASEWQNLPVDLFWNDRLIPDIVSAYYAYPSAWSAMGFGGPASPRGYVRLQANRRDPWEAAERKDGHLIPAGERNLHAK
ncbi:gluconate 2-dehydrogenase subunit 3 family protein [Stakelama sp. CBK3Z-3]|uniref:Gluconate 2-dehydrogenase subunit 3 family protein n=1 Tax=Stakelama flava TaxID=2860338 RepID=A0ABS6XP63_9SPHN|nr:gluconate 2-dehydrogenase subunit 3 family protein [Stakelama flava]MBW4332013.1 gluconate 2-dehydrogenase subunit 3 family protein [Stakelama flava]